ncbi:MAG: hypothetical protein Q4A67_05980 [Aerococcus sp.]|nr:hypothetical protein [Aerococcus sp.]
MQYRSVLSNRDLKKQAMQAIKGNRLGLFFAMIVQLLITLLVVGGFVFTVVSLDLIPTISNPLAFLLNIQQTGPALIQALVERLTPPLLALLVGMGVVMSFLMTHLWTYGFNHSLLEMVDTGKFHYGTVWRSFVHRPFRHYLTALIVGIINQLLGLVYGVSQMVLGVFFYITLLTVQSPTIAPWLGIAVILLYTILAVLVLILLALLLSWISYGFQLFVYPSWDVKTTSIGRSVAMSWRLMRGNKWQLFILGLSYLVWPIVLTGVAVLAYLLFGAQLPSTYAAYVLPGWGVFFWVMLAVAFVRFLTAEAVFYRDQTTQYARRLNDQYPGFNATPKADLVAQYHTEAHPRFTAETLAVELPSAEEWDQALAEHAANKDTASQSSNHGTTKKYRVKPTKQAGESPIDAAKHYHVTTQSQTTSRHVPKAADPGYRLDMEQVSRPTAAKDIFNGKDASENEEK